jgi:superfamily II DNA or RNA helicase
MSLEIGQRVLFRSLSWEVADTSSDAFVELFGLSDENRGRRVRVLLGLDGAAIERAETPPLRWTIGETGWDVRQWKALHDAFRFTLSHSRGNLASVDWGRLILEPYQLEPLRQIEKLPFPRLLLADDVGLGKTAEAGLILFRLMQKRRAERVLVLCKAQPEPERWQRELAEKFGIEAVVINDHTDFTRLRKAVPSHLNVFGYYPRIIMSMHFAIRPHILADLQREVRWDVAIIDEAHHVAERDSGRKQLAELGRVVAERAEALLLLTATPHDGKGTSYASLIRLLDPYAVIDPDSINFNLVNPLVVRRLKHEVEKADGSRFLQRKITVLDVEGYRSKAERYLERGLRAYATRLEKIAKHFEETNQSAKAFGATFLGTFFRKRLASSVYACRLSLEERLKTIQEGPQPPKTDDVALETPTLWEAAESDLTDAPALVTDDAPSTEALEGLVFSDGKTEAEVVEDLLARAGKIVEEKESKVQALLALLERLLSHSQEKVVIFTEFRHTLDLLERVLKQNGYGSMILTYHGATPPAEREEKRQAFLNDPRARIFLATDAASEGINLHKSCNILIHVEVPWNPNRYEQRNGRIDRYGQRQQPEVFLLVATGSVEQRIARVVVEKLERINRELGSVSNVFPLTQKVSVESFLSQLDTQQNAENEETLEENAEQGQDLEKLAQKVDDLLNEVQQQEAQTLATSVPLELIKGETFGRTERMALEKELEASRAFVPEYRDVEEFLRFFFTTAGIVSEGGGIYPTREEGIWRVDVPRTLQKALKDRKGVLIESYPRATFQRSLAIAEAERDATHRVEFLSPGHPLVQAALRHMRGLAFRPGFPSRMAYRRTPQGSVPGFLFTCAMRFVDGRGETIEERFEAIFVGLDGTASKDSEADMRLFVEKRPFGNLSEREEIALLPAFKAAFESVQRVARQEMLYRQDLRCTQLSSGQQEIANQAFVSLGGWEEASRSRLKDRLSGGVQAGKVTQLSLDLTGEQRRRETLFRKELEKLMIQKDYRYRQIKAMREVRGETIDEIGVLVLIPESMQE